MKCYFNKVESAGIHLSESSSFGITNIVLHGVLNKYNRNCYLGICSSITGSALHRPFQVLLLSKIASRTYPSKVGTPLLFPHWLTTFFNSELAHWQSWWFGGPIWTRQWAQLSMFAWKNVRLLNCNPCSEVTSMQMGCPCNWVGMTWQLATFWYTFNGQTHDSGWTSLIH